MDQSNLGYSAKNEYEFLDLSDVDDIERTRLSSALLHKQQKQQQKYQPQLQLFDKHERVSLIKHDAADVQSRVSQSTTSTDNEYQIVLNNNYNIESNLSCISSSQNAPSVTNNSAETKQFFRLSYKELSKLSHSNREQMAKISPHVNSQEDLTQQGANQQVQPQIPMPGNSQTTPSQPAQLQHTQQTSHSQAPQSLQQPHPQLSHPTNSASNIPSHNVQSQVYQQSQPQFVSNYLPHVGPVSPGSIYISPSMASMYYSPTIQPPFLSANFTPTDNHQNNVEQTGSGAHFGTNFVEIGCDLAKL